MGKGDVDDFILEESGLVSLLVDISAGMAEQAVAPVV